MMKKRFKEKRPKRLGAMQVTPTRHTEPSYFRALLSVGLVDPKTHSEDAWGVWQRVCSDEEFMQLSMKLEKQNKVSIPSVAAPFKNGTQVLAALSEKQILALKERIGVS